MSFNGRKLARNEQTDRIFYVYENSLPPGGCLPQPRGYINVYDHNVQTSSSLKPLSVGQNPPRTESPPLFFVDEDRIPPSISCK